MLNLLCVSTPGLYGSIVAPLDGFPDTHAYGTLLTTATVPQRGDLPEYVNARRQ